MLLVWLLLPPAALFLLSLSKPLYTDRYVIWIAPAFAILLAQGVAGLRIVWRPLGWIALAGLLALSGTGVWRQSHEPIKADMRATAAYVQAHRQPEDRIVFQMPYIRHTFEYYAGPQPDAVDGSYTNNGLTVEQWRRRWSGRWMARGRVARAVGGSALGRSRAGAQVAGGERRAQRGSGVQSGAGRALHA